MKKIWEIKIKLLRKKKSGKKKKKKSKKKINQKTDLYLVIIRPVFQTFATPLLLTKFISNFWHSVSIPLRLLQGLDCILRLGLWIVIEQASLIGGIIFDSGLH